MVRRYNVRHYHVNLAKHRISRNCLRYGATNCSYSAVLATPTAQSKANTNSFAMLSIVIPQDGVRVMQQFPYTPSLDQRLPAMSFLVPPGSSGEDIRVMYVSVAQSASDRSSTILLEPGLTLIRLAE